ncbi:MAG: lysophospholipid acyltransferase family protein [Gammaproteobacteria bacterium]
MLRILFHAFIVKPLVSLILGIHVRNRDCLPTSGPAIVVANHNSHLDALALMSLFPLTLIHRVHPVAAADYFFANKLLKWLALNAIGVIPIERSPTKIDRNLLAPLLDALDQGSILILFPEGTRGEPERMSKLKNGLGHLIGERPQVPIVPVFFHGLGKSLPKGEYILVPFFIDAFVGQALHWEGSRRTLMEKLSESMGALQNEAMATAAIRSD